MSGNVADMIARFAGLVSVFVLVTACQADDTRNGRDRVPDQLAAFGVDVIEINTRPLFVAIADTRSLRTQGLMNVEDLGTLDGMLFVFSNDTSTEFHMEDTMMPLDIAFFAADGTLVSVTQMTPCLGDPCRDYRADGHYRYAFEARQGDLIDLPVDSVLTIDPP